MTENRYNRQIYYFNYFYSVYTVFEIKKKVVVVAKLGVRF